METKKTNNGGCVMLVIIFLILMFLMFLFSSCPGSSSSSSSYSSGTETCPSCHRKFQGDSENARSIRWHGMCTNCYNNYKYASDALKERPLN